MSDTLKQIKQAKSFDEKCAQVDMCPKCGGELDTGWECNSCGFDAMPLVVKDRRAESH